MTLHSSRLFSCCTTLFRCHFIGWTWMIASPLQSYSSLPWDPRRRRKKRILLTPRSLCWVHYSCPRPRMRTDIDLILRWKPLCTSAGPRVGRGLVTGRRNKDRKSCFLHGEENKEVSQTFIFQLKTSPQRHSSRPVCGHILGLDLAVHFTFTMSQESSSPPGLFAQRKLDLLHSWV